MSGRCKALFLNEYVSWVWKFNAQSAASPSHLRMDESEDANLPREPNRSQHVQRRRSPSSGRLLRWGKMLNLQKYERSRAEVKATPLNRGLWTQWWSQFSLNRPAITGSKLTVLETLNMASRVSNVQAFKRWPRSCLRNLRNTVKVLESINTNRIIKCKNQEILNMYICICFDSACFDQYQ